MDVISGQIHVHRARPGTGERVIDPRDFAAAPCGARAHLRILATSDLHMNIAPYDYFGDRPGGGASLAAAANLIRAARAEAPNALLLDNGDFLQGTPMGDYIASGGALQPGETHPLVAAMNALGFDACTLGNHEFNYGVDFLRRVLAGARFPAVSANVLTRQGTTPAEDTTFVRPYVMIDREMTCLDGTSQPLRIGVIGFTPPQITTWDKHLLKGRIETRGILESARAYVGQMKAEGADVIIALSHSGIARSGASTGGRDENASLELAAVPGIDAVICGHSHGVFPSPAMAGLDGIDAQAGTLHGTPAVMPGAMGSHLGVIDLLLERRGGRWQRTVHNSRAVPVEGKRSGSPSAAGARGDRAVLGAARRAHRLTLNYMRKPAGRSSQPLFSDFALAGLDRGLGLIHSAQKAGIAAFLAGTGWEGLPVLSAACPFRAGGMGGTSNFTNIPAGTIALRDVASLYPYPNRLHALRITGAQLRLWLERAASSYALQSAGQTGPLMAEGAVSHNLCFISGAEYEIDLTAAALFDTAMRPAMGGEGRIRNLRCNGAAVRDTDRFVLAASCFRASGSGGFAEGISEADNRCTGRALRDVICTYLGSGGALSPLPMRQWRFAPVRGAEAYFDSTPAALARLGDTAGLKIAGMGEAPGGFARLSLHL